MLMGIVGTFWDGGVEILLEAVVSRFVWCNLCVECTLERCVGQLGFSIVVIGMSGHRQYLKINHISSPEITSISVLLQWFLQESVSGSK